MAPPDAFWCILFTDIFNLQYIQLSFDAFATIKHQDYVDIYDSYNSSNVIWSLSGIYGSPIIITSTQRYLYLQFTSDDSTGLYGFNASFQSVSGMQAKLWTILHRNVTEIKYMKHDSSPWPVYFTPKQCIKLIKLTILAYINQVIYVVGHIFSLSLQFISLSKWWKMYQYKLWTSTFYMQV